MQNALIVNHNPNHQPITKAVIWLHGLGADGHDFEPIVPHLGLPCDLGVRFIFPHAPKMPVTINGGYVMSSWYDILAMDDLLREVDTAHIEQAALRIQSIIQSQVDDGLALADIVVAGFSQGGAVAYHVALATQGLGGLLALSTYFATADVYQQRAICAKMDLPILIQHGNYDDIVSPYFAQKAKEVLENLGLTAQINLYPAAHHLHPKQISDIGKWLCQVFA